MKKNLFVLALLIAGGLSANASIGNLSDIAAANAVVAATPPVAVLQSFASIFGAAKVSEWKLRSDGNWRAHFLRNGIKWQATFTASGVLVKSEPA